MTSFLIVAALLLGGSLCFVLPTLLRRGAAASQQLERSDVNLAVLRDQLRELDADLAAGTIDQPGYASARLELERRVLDDVVADPHATTGTQQRWAALALGLAVPLVAVALYTTLGTPAGLDPAQVAGREDPAHPVTDAQITGMVATLAERLKTKPNDAEGWNMLARSYGILGRFPEAVDAYKHLVKLVPDNADVLADYADALAMAQDKTLLGEPERLITHALALDANNIKALSLQGSINYERRDFAGAVAQWKKVLALVPADSDMARATISSIGEAQNMAGGGAVALNAAAGAGGSAASASTTGAGMPATAANAEKAPVPGAASVSGKVELDPAVRAKVADTDTVFIFARAVDGPRFPLAVLRKQVKDLPTSFVLDDSMSMAPNAKLSGYASVIVGARISKSGNATPSAGDLEGVTEPVHPGAKDLVIRIGSERK